MRGHQMDHPRPPRARAAGLGTRGLGVRLTWAAASAVLLAACSQAAAPSSAPAPVTGSALAVPLASSVTSATSSWAILPMGHLDDPENTFWQLFVRAAGSPSWSLGTPPGVADNGGLVMTSGSMPATTVGFEPSQDLRFSPLAQTADLGHSWAAGSVPTADLVLRPDALASAGPTVFALERSGGGTLVAAPASLASWHEVETLGALARTPAARGCGPTALTAVAVDAVGDPLLGATCTGKGAAGLFVERDGGWDATGPVLGGLPAASPTSVLRLVGSGSASVGLLGVGTGAGRGVMATWSTSGTAAWKTSPVLPVAPPDRIVCSAVGASGGLMVLVGGAGGSLHLFSVAGPGAVWEALAAPPSGTVDVASGTDGTAEALTLVHGSQLVVSVLGSGSAAWEKVQAITVPVQYGSSS